MLGVRCLVCVCVCIRWREVNIRVCVIAGVRKLIEMNFIICSTEVYSSVMLNFCLLYFSVGVWGIFLRLFLFVESSLIEIDWSSAPRDR